MPHTPKSLIRKKLHAFSLVVFRRGCVEAIPAADGGWSGSDPRRGRGGWRQGGTTFKIMFRSGRLRSETFLPSFQRRWHGSGGDPSTPGWGWFWVQGDPQNKGPKIHNAFFGENQPAAGREGCCALFPHCSQPSPTPSPPPHYTPRAYMFCLNIGLRDIKEIRRIWLKSNNNGNTQW